MLDGYLGLLSNSRHIESLCPSCPVIKCYLSGCLAGTPSELVYYCNFSRGITLVGATYFCDTQRIPQGGSLRGQPSKCFAGSFLTWRLHSNVLVVWSWPCLLCFIVGQRRVALWTEMSAISGVLQAVHLVPTAATSTSLGTRVLTSQMTCCTHSLSNSSIELHLCALLA